MRSTIGRLLKIEGSSLTGIKMATWPGFGFGRSRGVGRNFHEKKRLRRPKYMKMPSKRTKRAKAIVSAIAGHSEATAIFCDPSPRPRTSSVLVRAQLEGAQPVESEWKWGTLTCRSLAWHQPSPPSRPVSDVQA